QLLVFHYATQTTICLFFLISRPPPRSPLFPYTTLFRSSKSSSSAASTPSIVSSGSPVIAAPSPAVIACPLTVIAPRTTWIHAWRSEEHTSELQSRGHLVCRLLLEKKDKALT